MNCDGLAGCAFSERDAGQILLAHLACNIIA